MSIFKNPLNLNNEDDDEVIISPQPRLDFKDSDCVADDVNASINIQATDTGDGSEDIDLFIQQQIAGTMTTFVEADADGNITLGDGSRDVVLSGPTSVVNDFTISSTTPKLILKDSNCAVSDNNVEIYAEATDTGDGSEDIDVIFKQQIAGSLTTFLNSDADGDITLGDSSRDIALSGGLVCTPSTTTSLSAGDTIPFLGNTIQRVAGSGGAVTLTSTPSIADATDGQILIVQGDDDTNTLTLQDESNLANSGLQLSGGADMTLGKGDIIVLTYDSGDDKWYELSRSNN